MTDAPADRARAARRSRSPLDFAGGLFLIGLAAVGYVGGFSLPFGQLSGIGSGLMPKVVAVLVGAFGVLLLVCKASSSDGDRLERWAVRGAAACVLRPRLRVVRLHRSARSASSSPARCAVMFSALADRDTRPVEVVVFRGLTDVGVRLPVQGAAQPADSRSIPLGILGPVMRAYDGAKAAVGHVFGAWTI